ncbi:hypothetical protein FACS1894133_2950 [Clostridia bacterium]|nr:hypothetical protein FACS1894133_2950 [Clostridia bacterium]
MKRILSVLTTAAVLTTLLTSCTLHWYTVPEETESRSADVTAPEQTESRSADAAQDKPAPDGAGITARFTDANFLSFVRELTGKTGDEPILASDVAEIETVNVQSGEIASLSGIEYFTALVDLDCSNNKLTSLDISKNAALTYLNCGDNKLTVLNLRMNTALTELRCYGNQLNKLDLKKNTALTLLSCNGNKLATLDVSRNTDLAELDCHDNRLKKLDLSKNTALADLVWDDDVAVTGYDTDTAQRTTITQGNSDITAKFTDENFLYYVRQRIRKEDGEPILTSDVAGIERIVVSNELIYSLNGIEYFTSLKELACFNNNLGTIDVSRNTALTYLDVGDTELKTLDVSRNTALKTLYCTGNQITNLDLSKNTLLTYLRCDEYVTVTGYKGNTAQTPPAIFWE